MLHIVEWHDNYKWSTENMEGSTITNSNQRSSRYGAGVPTTTPWLSVLLPTKLNLAEVAYLFSDEHFTALLQIRNILFLICRCYCPKTMISHTFPVLTIILCSHYYDWSNTNSIQDACRLASEQPFLFSNTNYGSQSDGVGAFPFNVSRFSFV
jgi:hypothetical protein